MQKLTWQQSIPQFSQFNAQIEKYNDLTSRPLTSLQPRLDKALNRLLDNNPNMPMLMLCAPDVQDYYSLLTEQLTNLSAKTIIQAQDYDEISLFGCVYPKSNHNQNEHNQQGLLHKANNGVLILSIQPLLKNASLWQRLKQSIALQKLHWKSVKPTSYTELPPAQDLNLTLILLGDRYSLADFEEFEPEVHQLFHYSEYELELDINQSNINHYLSCIKHLQQQFNVKPLSSEAISLLLQQGSRETQNCNKQPLCPLWFKSILSEANFHAQNQSIHQQDIENAISEKNYRENYVAHQTREDLLNGQIHIETQGEKIGQVNGLSYIEIPGHPLVYGEPVRLSCVYHIGEPDITDVERKVELGGNLHAKGMLVMQAYIHSALKLREPLPYSASLVFEQSYSEIDGDSASLAGLCAYISAIAHHPLKQSIALTGAVDQFGQVHAIGGINEKIESFFFLCKQRGLTSEQGVILPKSNISALCLNSEVVSAIKENNFHLWAVENVEEVFPLLADLPFKAQEEEQESILSKITDNIEDMQRDGNSASNIFDIVRSWFSKDHNL